MKETEDLYLFWRHQFGQWNQREMIDFDGVVYCCCEQYMMAKKAQLFGDLRSQEKIMRAADPGQQQELGRIVTGYDQRLWDRNKFAIVWYANYLKFTQHADLRERLFATGNKVLAEASPVDLIWGIGFEADADQALDPSQWRGQNLLGEVLMSVRSALNIPAANSDVGVHSGA